MEWRIREVVLVLGLSLLASCGHVSKGGTMTIEKESFGKTKDGTGVSLYTLINDNGVKATITNSSRSLVRFILNTSFRVVIGWEAESPRRARFPAPQRRRRPKRRPHPRSLKK